MNLNPKYKIFNNIDEIKTIVRHIDYKTLLDQCPRLKIPVGTILYHSNAKTSSEILNFSEYTSFYNDNHNIKYYPNTKCIIKDNIPHENIGDKPRITEIINNPGTPCRFGRQERMYGNFNFAGNYDIAIARQMKATHIMICVNEITLVDLSFMSLELGFSPKRFFRDTTVEQNEFGEQSKWKSYCEENNLDGLLMIDPVDLQNVTNETQTILSCYWFNINNIKGYVCPEFVLIHNRGKLNIDHPVGTDKLRLLGVVDLVDKYNNKLSRDETEKLFNIFFTRLKQNCRAQNVKLEYGYDNISKRLIITKGYIVNPDEIVRCAINLGDDAYVNYSSINDIPDVNVFGHDNYLINSSLVKLRTSEQNIILGIELYSGINLKETKAIPLNNPNYVYKDGSMVKSYASDRLYDYILQGYQIPDRLLYETINKFSPNYIKTLYLNEIDSNDPTLSKSYIDLYIEREFNNIRNNFNNRENILLLTRYELGFISYFENIRVKELIGYENFKKQLTNELNFNYIKNFYIRELGDQHYSDGIKRFIYTNMDKYISYQYDNIRNNFRNNSNALINYNINPLNIVYKNIVINNIKFNDFKTYILSKINEKWVEVNTILNSDIYGMLNFENKITFDMCLSIINRQFNRVELNNILRTIYKQDDILFNTSINDISLRKNARTLLLLIINYISNSSITFDQMTQFYSNNPQYQQLIRYETS